MAKQVLGLEEAAMPSLDSGQVLVKKCAPAVSTPPTRSTWRMAQPHDQSGLRCGVVVAGKGSMPTRWLGAALASIATTGFRTPGRGLIDVLSNGGTVKRA